MHKRITKLEFSIIQQYISAIKKKHMINAPRKNMAPFALHTFLYCNVIITIKSQKAGDIVVVFNTCALKPL
jgi:hypothetical protein